ncbi:hypothetical protein Selli1_28470 [Sellimonas catena]|uniref:Uncharacterized protein n=1 Tax=Sellimonas catena TaxID=2994035 RepID=A0A9W6C837_9FIRM|nr:hypothetical protein Selli1_28470 [Sellimonas catena]
MGRLIIAEFKDNETHPFDEIMEVFRKYPISKNIRWTTHRPSLFPILKYFQIKEGYIAGNRKYF